MTNSDLLERLRLYCETRNRAIELSLGDGTDGGVWQTTKRTAVKVFLRRENYEIERSCYQLLMEQDVTEIQGFAIPRLIDFDNGLMIVEMDIVEPPYILDFGKAYLFRPPPQFSAEVMRESEESQQELWGEYWPTIGKILARLRGLGIYHVDPSPRNIRPVDWDPPID